MPPPLPNATHRLALAHHARDGAAQVSIRSATATARRRQRKILMFIFPPPTQIAGRLALQARIWISGKSSRPGQWLQSLRIQISRYIPTNAASHKFPFAVETQRLAGGEHRLELAVGVEEIAGERASAPAVKMVVAVDLGDGGLGFEAVAELQNAVAG